MSEFIKTAIATVIVVGLLGYLVYTPKPAPLTQQLLGCIPHSEKELVVIRLHTDEITCTHHYRTEQYAARYK